MKIDPYYQQQKCRPLTLVPGDVRFVRIFAGVLRRKTTLGLSKTSISIDFGRYVFGTLGHKANVII